MTDPSKLNDRELLATYQDYITLQARGVRDEMYIAFLENEIIRRKLKDQ